MVVVSISLYTKAHCILIFIFFCSLPQPPDFSAVSSDGDGDHLPRSAPTYEEPPQIDFDYGNDDDDDDDDEMVRGKRRPAPEFVPAPPFGRRGSRDDEDEDDDDDGPSGRSVPSYAGPPSEF